MLKLAALIALLSTAIAVPISNIPVGKGECLFLELPSPFSSYLLLESLITEEFRNFMTTYGRSYGSTEELLHRASVFASNLAHINFINSNPANTWKAAVNIFADQTKEEMSRLKVRLHLLLFCFT
jgi:hypothetical protein